MQVLRRIALVLLAVSVLAGSECIASCSVLPCESGQSTPAENLPPCHEHSKPKPQEPKPAAHCILTQRDVELQKASAVHYDAVTIFFAASHDAVAVLPVTFERKIGDPDPPPQYRSAKPAVLRI